MVYFVEEAFQVYINDMIITLMDVLLRLLYALVRIFARTKAIAVVFEPKLEQRCDGLRNGLLKLPVCYGRNTQQTGLAACLWNVNP